jgi:hypothetical protein
LKELEHVVEIRRLMLEKKRLGEERWRWLYGSSQTFNYFLEFCDKFVIFSSFEGLIFGLYHF